MSISIERDYLAAFRELVTVDVWKEVVTRAIESAKQGDPHARAWLTKLVLGPQPMTLTALAVRESLGVSAFGEVEALAWASVDFEGEDVRAGVGIVEGMSISTAQKETAKAERRARRQARQLPESSTPAALPERLEPGNS